MRRWLLLPLALGVAALAAYAILSGPPQNVASPPPDEVVTPPPAKRVEDENVSPSPTQHPEIREESRGKLREILREAKEETR